MSSALASRSAPRSLSSPFPSEHAVALVDPKDPAPMIVVMRQDALPCDVANVVTRVEHAGARVHPSKEGERTVVGVVGRGAETLRRELETQPGVEAVVDVAPPYKLASREYRRADTVVDVRGVSIGGRRPVLIAGPCAVESHERMLAIANAVKAAGADLLRGGAFKPRTSPYAFRGLGAEGLAILSDVGRRVGLPVVSEILAPSDVDLFTQHVDVLQVGARNMQNFNLLEEVGRAGKPVLLKRGMMSTVEELLLSTEYVLSHGNARVILCERGIRTFETATRNTPDVAAIPVVDELSHLPILFDPSHAAGQRRYVPALARAAVAAGADGLLVEVHDRPDEALCDGKQALLPSDFTKLVPELQQIAAAIGRPFESASAARAR